MTTAAAGLSIGFAHINGVFDEPLSSIGLNWETCAENLFGNKLCGDDLADFCEDNYNPSLNGDTCAPVLRERGIDPDALAEYERNQERAYERCVDRAIATEGMSLADCERP